MAKDPQTSAQRWAANLAAAGPKIGEGVDAVTVSPGTLAARQVEVWAQNTAAAKGKFARRVGQVTLEDWRRSMKEKGVQRIAAGAQDSIPKMAQFLTAFLPHVEAGRRALPPRGNLEQNIARMTAMVRHNAKFQQTGGGM